MQNVDVMKRLALLNFKNNNMNPMVFGSKSLQLLVHNTNMSFGAGVIFMTELAHAKDKDKDYWLVKKNDDSFITIISDDCIRGWGTIRKAANGRMEICQVMPREIEQDLRQQTIDTLKARNKDVSGMSGDYR